MHGSRTWLTTDTHLFHKRLAEAGLRPENFHDRVVSEWRANITTDDLVIHLGDVALGRRSAVAELLPTLPGRKVLVRGNHDKESDGWYMNHGFMIVVESMVFRDVLLTHRPTDALPKGAVGNVHGHLHNLPHHAELDGIRQPWHLLLALEDTNYRPVIFEKFVAPLYTPTILSPAPEVST